MFQVLMYTERKLWGGRNYYYDYNIIIIIIIITTTTTIITIIIVTIIIAFGPFPECFKISPPPLIVSAYTSGSVQQQL